MELREVIEEHWIKIYFGFDLLLFAAAFLMWQPGTRPLAAGLFVLALIIPLAFLTVLFTNLMLNDHSAEPD